MEETGVVAGLTGLSVMEKQLAVAAVPHDIDPMR